MPSLATLPAVIIGQIASKLCLCRHCAGPDALPRCRSSNRCFPVSCHCFCDPNKDKPDPPFDPRTHTRNLSALTLTCRPVRDASLQYLYHRPDLTTKWHLLATTALLNPRLASFVRELYLPEEYTHPKSMSEIPPNVLSYYQSGLSSAGLTSFREPDALVTTHTDDEISLLASLFPNLESIEAVIGYDESDNSEDDKTFHFPPLTADKKWSRLRNVELVYWNTEEGIRLRCLVVDLLHRAPNLERLGIHGLRDKPMHYDDIYVDGVFGEGQVQGDEIELMDHDQEVQQEDQDLMSAKTTPVLPLLTQLKELDLQCTSIGPNVLGTILTMTPNIERFLYSTGGRKTGPSQFHHAQMRDVMLRKPNLRLERLKHVEVDFGWAHECFDFKQFQANWDCDGVDEDLEESYYGTVEKDFARRGVKLVMGGPTY
ncbi:hypothetical protein B0H66DRAFT_568417 [Apodospora peruviana]|uniref:F-box domain-containing protein n=1 Tax=Apodospora peruviana TaxID=516989 RepID=A0AAE0M0C5_9PEZI|nr:hypothetical protein B0H66DRAFT_568417 [Apodospora peruviana]